MKISLVEYNNPILIIKLNDRKKINSERIFHFSFVVLFEKCLGTIGAVN